MEAEADHVLKKWTSFINVQRNNLPSRIRKEMQSFQDLYGKVPTLIREARKRQTNNDAVVRLWSRRVGQIAYDADEVMDELLYKINVTRQRQTDRRIFAIKRIDDHIQQDPVSFPSSACIFRRELYRQISTINQMLKDTLQDAVKFRLEMSSPLHDHSTSCGANHRLAARFDKSKVIGMECYTNFECRRIILLLSMAQPSASQSVIGVPVVIILGSVKAAETTLYQIMSYNNDPEHFPYTVQVRINVADGFVLETILIRILESILFPGERFSKSDHSNLPALADTIKEKLNGSRLLLVIVDLRNEDTKVWNEFKSYFSRISPKGSKILVTTCSVNVAELAGGAITTLREMPDHYCWLILEQYAFCQFGAMKTPEMVEIGRELARKCLGLPSAAKYLGILLHRQKDESSWLAWRDRDISATSIFTDIIFPAMMCQYDDLPLHLKRCFSYFSLFFQDQEIHREYLIPLWIAEGFIELSDETDDMSMEDIGNQHFDNLLGIVYEDAEMEKDEFGYVKSFRLDSFTRQLARQVGDECANLKGNEIENKTEVRHLRFNFARQDLRIAKNFRSVVGIQFPCRYIPDNQITRIISCKQLRVIEIRNYTFEKLPHFSKMIHLRYLDLSDCKGVSLGQSVSALWYLQRLVLRGCCSLTELPRDFGSLKNLRYLDLSYTGIMVLPDSSNGLQSLQKLYLNNSQLQQLPTNFGASEQLRHLDVSSTDIKTLPNTITSLSNLRTFKFVSCRYLEVLPLDFGKLTHLTCLDLSGTRIKELHDSIISGLCNLETLILGHCKLPQEVGNLKRLKHFMFEGDKFETPRGISQLTRLETLQQLVVREDIESDGGGIGDLKSLNLLTGKIKICKLENVRRGEDAKRANLQGKRDLRCLELHWSWRPFDVEYRYNDGVVLDALQPHPDLERLEIKNFKGFKPPYWMGKSLSSHLPKLEELVLTECNQWEQLPALGQLQNLKVLYISGMNSVKRLGNEFYKGECSTSEEPATCPFPSLIELKLEMKNLEGWDAPQSTLPPFPLMEKLTISRCNTLKVVQTPFPSLKELEFQSCQLLEDLPDIQCLKVLQKFTAKGCKKLKLLPDALKHVFSTALLDVDTPIDSF